MAAPPARVGVMLMTYGSPSSLDDVGRYLAAVRGGRAPDDELLAEFRRRYEVIGGSPLIEITTNQAAALEARFDGAMTVRAAMRFSEPSTEVVLREIDALGVTRVATIVLSPQFSPMLMGGYAKAIEAARAAIGSSAPEAVEVGAWHREPAFADALGARVREGLGRFPAEIRDRVPVLLTAHSLPRRVAERDPDYLGQLRETADLVAAAAGIGADRWTFCWQSAGHEPGEWMSPDFADLMPVLHADGHRHVLVAPIQFLSDHLEILYDIDIGAREEAERVGLGFQRIDSLNTAPRFIDALESIARRALGLEPSRPLSSSG